MVMNDFREQRGAEPDRFAKWNRDIVSLFEEQVRRAREATALIDGNEKLSYNSLNSRANHLARHIATIGVTPGAYVGICLERSIDAIVGVLAILKTGAAYLPIDPQHPVERVRFILQDSGVSLNLTSRAMDPELLEILVNPIYIDDAGARHCYASSNPRIDIPASSPAYVMYTSGTTGSPKAAAIPQSGVSRLVRNANYIQLDSTDVILHHSTCAFDAATFEIWAALLNGGTLVIHRPSIDLASLGSVLRNNGITTLLLTTSVFHLVAEHKPDCLATLTQVVTGGDVLRARLLKKVIDQYPHLTIINGYGPTENTTFTCCYVVTSETVIGETVPIGKPISGTNVFILDEDLHQVNVGEVGQLYTNGLGLGRGYLNRSDLTQQHFIESPFPEAGGLLYRTGDLAYEDADGNFHFAGRIDRQVKIRGFRVEPGEIEHALNARPDVAEAVVVAEQTQSSEKQLVAYIKRSNATSPLNAEEIERYLSCRLPHYMVPAEIHVLDSLPLTSNGKIATDLLRGIVSDRGRVGNSEVALNGFAQVVLDVWQRQLQTSSLQVDTSVYDYGASSLTIMVVHSELNERLNCLVDPVELTNAQTPLDWANIYERHSANEADGRNYERDSTIQINGTRAS